KRHTPIGVSQISHSAIQQISSSKNQGVSFNARHRSQSFTRVNAEPAVGGVLTPLPYLIPRRRRAQGHAGAHGVRDERVASVHHVALDEPERAPGVLDAGPGRDAAGADGSQEVHLHLDGPVTPTLAASGDVSRDT